ncbi:MAG TPA: hypothetical protein PLC04_03835 [Candidatus Kapabacteria bacterium]|nr:hypothetical protein [Candidatus Kapabacteria bacterium]
MNKTKLVILIIVIIGVFVCIYFLFPPTQTSKLSVVVTILDNQHLNDYLNQISDKTIEEIIANKPLEIDMTLLSASNTPKNKIHLKMKPNESEIQWENTIKNAFVKLLKDTIITSLTNQSANDLIAQTIKMIKDKSKNSEYFFIITGSFPECYDKESAISLKNNILETSKGLNTTNKIIWNVLDTRENEEEILKTMQTANFCPILDRRIIFEKSRVCLDSSLTNLYCIFFDKLTSDQVNEFWNFIKNNYGKNINLTIWNVGPLNNKTIRTFGKDTLINEEIQLLENLTKGTWTSIGYLFKQASNNLMQINDSIPKNLIIFGNLPSEDKGSQLDPQTWKRLNNIKNLSITLYKPKGVKDNKTDKAIIEGFKYYKINYKKY